jgi:hypothetical protein
MSVTVSKNHFNDKSDAERLLLSVGLTRRDGAMTSGDLEDIHWHKTSLKIFVLSGSFETLDATSGQTLVAGCGDLISIPAQTLHAARCPQPATYLVGFESAEAMRTFGPQPAATYPGSSP